MPVGGDEEIHTYIYQKKRKMGKYDAPVDVSVLLEVGEAQGTEAAQQRRVPHRRPVLDAGPHLLNHGEITGQFPDVHAFI